MSDAQTRVGQLLSEYEDSELFFTAGAATAIISWFVIPLIGLIAVYCGYQLYHCSDRWITSAVFVLMGASAVINHFYFVFIA